MNQRSRLSLLVIQILVLSLMVSLIGRLFYLQVAAGPKYRDAALSIQSRDIVSPANRGLIVDSSGVPLALNKVGLAVTVDRLTLDKQADKGATVLTKVAKLLGLQYGDVYRNTRLCGEIPAGDKTGCWTGTRYQPIPITRDADPNIGLQIVERADEFPGVTAAPLSLRSYPGEVGVKATHVLGYVGPLSDEDIKTNPGKYYRSESIGKAGLEIQYDKYLRGIPGIRTVIVDRKESITQQSKNTAPIAGSNLVTSLDVRLQAATESALTDAVRRARASGYRGDSGAAIVMDIKTGRVLAMASYPDFDPNIWEKGLTVAQAKSLFSESVGVPALSRAIQGQYAPASTFKAFSVLAADKAGYNLNSRYNCPAQVTVGNRDFQNFESKAQGFISLKTAIAVSCDTIWYQIAFDEWLRDGGLSPKAKPHDYFFNVAHDFQLDLKTGIDLPSELGGRIPDRKWRQDWYDQNKNYFCNYQARAPMKQQTAFLVALAKENCTDGMMTRAGDAVNFSIGQGDTLLTPLKLTQAYAAIANGGTIWQPTIARAIVAKSGAVIKEISPRVVGKVDSTPEAFSFLKSALREVVVSGTAAGSFAGFPIPISGKTGTAEVFGLNPNGSKKDNTSWFASFGPSDKPRYAVVMMVSQGGFGASTSAAGVRKIYETLFGVRGSQVDPKKALFPDGPPISIPNISAATKVKK